MKVLVKAAYDNAMHSYGKILQHGTRVVLSGNLLVRALALPCFRSDSVLVSQRVLHNTNRIYQLHWVVQHLRRSFNWASLVRPPADDLSLSHAALIHIYLSSTSLAGLHNVYVKSYSTRWLIFCIAFQIAVIQEPVRCFSW